LLLLLMLLLMLLLLMLLLVLVLRLARAPVRFAGLGDRRVAGGRTVSERGQLLADAFGVARRHVRQTLRGKRNAVVRKASLILT